MQVNEIWLGDCLELMDRIPDGAVDAIICDPPYGVTNCKWDSVIPLEPMWAQFKRVIKPNGAIVMTASQPFTSVLVMSNLEWFKYEWVNDKKSPTNFLNAKKMPMNKHDNVVVFCEGQPTYNPQMRNDVGKPFGYIADSLSDCYGDFSNNRRHGIGFPYSIIEFSRPTNLTEPNGYGLHPTQKSSKLFAYLIRTYTNPGELVLDPVAGSGTTAISCIETGRRWLCIEKDTGYYDLATDRINERLLQPFLPEIVEAPAVKPEQLCLV